jgi:hypothetical protein
MHSVSYDTDNSKCNTLRCACVCCTRVESSHGDSTVQPAMEQSPEPYPKCI